MLNTTPPPDLLSKIMIRLRVERNLAKMRKKFWVSVTLTGLFLVASVPTWQELFKQFAATGFGDYLSLLWTDFGSVSLYWKDYLSSLLETMPVVNISAALFTAAAALGAARFAASQAKSNLLSNIN